MSKTPTTPKLGYVLLYVESVEQSLEFYTKVMGVPLRMHQGPYAELETGSTAFGIVSRELAGSHFDQPLPPSGLGASEVGFVVPRDEVDALYKRAIAAGAKSEVAPIDRPWGQRVSYVRDPDGHLVEICSPVGE
jgi:lactoylglutathione lyase